jgi:YVTN family beta-propeller protein
MTTGRRLALLIATYQYEDAGLRRLTSPAHDAEALAAVLQDPDIAGFEVTTLINEPHHRVGAAIGDFYRHRRRDDLTLLYFTGHGLKDDGGRLYLAMANTRRDSLLFTALSAEQIDQAMTDCASRQKVLVLDCCYSGAFPAGRNAKADPEVHALERFQGRGRTVLTASDATQYSFEGNEVHGEAAQSVFTRYLVAGLRDGSADLDGDGDITLDELYSYVYERVVEELPQQRPKKQDNVEGRTVIARNINWSLPAHLRQAIASPIVSDRLSALEGLDHLRRIGNDVVRGHVREEIQRLANDDSKQVSSAAAERLSAASPRPAPAAGSPPPQVAEVSEPQSAKLSQPPAAGAAPLRRSRRLAGFVTRRRHGRAPVTSKRRRRTVISASLTVSILLAAVGTVITVRVIRDSGSTTSSTTAGATVFLNGVTLNPDGRRLYVARDENVSVIDTAINKTVGSLIGRSEIRAVAGDTADISGVATSPDGRRLYVPNHDSATVSVIDIANNKLAGKPISVSGGPQDVAVSPDGRRLYVAIESQSSKRPGHIDVVDTKTHAFVGPSIAIDKDPSGMAISPDGRRLYVTQTQSFDVPSGTAGMSVIDIAKGKVTEPSIDVGKLPTRVAVSPDGHRIYVASFRSHSVSVINTETRRIVGRPIVVREPSGIAVSPDGRRLYVANYSSSTVSVVDTQTYKVGANLITVV